MTHPSATQEPMKALDSGVIEAVVAVFQTHEEKW